MRSKLYILTAFCCATFALFLLLALSESPDDCIALDADREVGRKAGDMHVSWYGRSYGSTIRSGRMESPRNRRFRGGGVHGGK